MKKQPPPRIRNYFLARDRHKDSDELPWTRISGLKRLELPRSVVLINGSYDLLHSGHMRLIAAARDKAATLVCALDSDRRVREAKGPGRPVHTFPERYTALGFMPIDYLVEIDSDEEMARLMEALRPDLRVQGYDYRRRPSRFPGVPKMFVRDGGMRTSRIIERIKNDSVYERHLKDRL